MAEKKKTKTKKSKNIENLKDDKNILFWVLFYFSWGLHEL